MIVLAKVEMITNPELKFMHMNLIRWTLLFVIDCQVCGLWVVSSMQQTKIPLPK